MLIHYRHDFTKSINVVVGRGEAQKTFVLHSEIAFVRSKF
jgi:hypothetical protein